MVRAALTDSNRRVPARKTTVRIKPVVEPAGRFSP
jgi:hypothetical protein